MAAALNRSAKRQLYRPAPSASKNSQLQLSSSKSLAQGIVNNDNTSWQEELSSSTIQATPKLEKVIFTSHKRERIPKVSMDNDAFKTPEKSPVNGKASESGVSDRRKSAEKTGYVTPERSKDQRTFRSINPYKNEVVVVDASGPILNPELSEVPTTSHTVFSPAKIICHSPSPDRANSPLGSGVRGSIRGVKVESPKKVIFGSPNPPKTDISDDTGQEVTQDSQPLETQKQEKSIKRKKKAARVVQSRYKNPKEPKPQKPAEATQKPGKPTAHSFIHDISAIASSSIMEGAMKGAGAKTKKAKVTSTPFNPAAWSEKTRMVADGSYLELSKNVTVGQHDVIRGLAKKEKEDRGSKVRNSAVTSKGKVSGADSGIVPGKQEHAEPVSEKQLEMEYCRMLQAMYLNAKAKDTFGKQEKEAKNQIFNVWQENQRLKAEVRQLEQTVEARKHTMALDQLLKVQDAGLRPIEESLDKLHNNYLTMGEALDSTRHYMPVEDVVIPDEGKLISALKESQMLLAEISSYTGTKKHDIDKMATNLNQMVEKLTSEIAEQDRCQELLIAANSLTNQERSLQSHVLQT